MPWLWHLSAPALICLLVGCGGPSGNAAGSGPSGTLVGPANDGAGGSSATESDVGVWSIDSGGGSVATDASVAHETTGGATATFVDDGALPPLLFAADSAPARSASDCKPGTYTGMFVMMVDFMGISGLTLQGPLSITLVANKPSPHPGEFNSNTLTVAPGATFTGTDDLGDVITADLSGQLDCGTHMFVGTLSNGVSYVFGSDAWTPRVDGTMSGTYDPSVSPPALTNGSFTFTSADVPGTTGSGSWSATLQ